MNDKVQFAVIGTDGHRYLSHWFETLGEAKEETARLVGPHQTTFIVVQMVGYTTPPVEYNEVKT